MKWTGLRILVSCAFAVSLALMIMIGLFSYRSIALLVRSDELRHRSNVVQKKFQYLLSELKDAETGQRGYLITAGEHYLEPYVAAVAGLNQTFKELRDLTAGDVEQQNSLDALEPLIMRKLWELKQTIDLRREKGFAEAQTVVLTDRGLSVMAEIRSVLGRVDSQEERKIVRLSEETESQTRVTVRVLFVGGALSVALLLSAFFLLHREITARARVGTELALSVEGLRKQTEVFESILRSIGDGVVVADEKGKFLTWNPAAEHIMGLGAIDVPLDQLTETYGCYLPDKVTPYPAFDLPLARAIGGEMANKVEMFVRNVLRPEGVWISVTGTPLKDGKDETRGGVVVLSEISERKQAEEEALLRDAEEIRLLNQQLEYRIMQRTAELEATNRELESFSYSVAHDLRAPLRHIVGFAKMLEEETVGLTAEAKRLVSRIRGGATQMGRLVDDLLDLAHLGRQELSLQATDLGALVEPVVAELKRDSAARSIEWKIDALPFAQCDPNLMEQVFVNLLSNAAKYSRPRHHACIEVGVVEINAETAIFVHDNGVGFSMKYADKLFGVFQRLHRAEDFEGTGIGLAIVQRIIHRHGGRVWAEAELDKGATFYFTLGTQKRGESTPKAASTEEAEHDATHMVPCEEKAA